MLKFLEKYWYAPHDRLETIMFDKYENLTRQGMWICFYVAVGIIIITLIACAVIWFTRKFMEGWEE